MNEVLSTVSAVLAQVLRRAAKGVSTLAVVGIAYPFTTAVLVVLFIVMTRQGIGAAVTVAVVIGAVIVGARMTMPRLSRALVNGRQKWTRVIFEAWKLREQKRHLSAAETRIRTSLYDATTDRTPMRSDDR